MIAEKRNGVRQAAVTELSYDHNGHQFQGRISDLSEGGFFIDSLNPLREGSLISFRFSLPGDKSRIPITGEGQVAWVLPLQGMGIRITRLSAMDQSRLKSYIPGK